VRRLAEQIGREGGEAVSWVFSKTCGSDAGEN
jgi:hypothetical protein